MILCVDMYIHTYIHICFALNFFQLILRVIVCVFVGIFLGCLWPLYLEMQFKNVFLLPVGFKSFFGSRFAVYLSFSLSLSFWLGLDLSRQPVVAGCFFWLKRVKVAANWTGTWESKIYHRLDDSNTSCSPSRPIPLSTQPPHRRRELMLETPNAHYLLFNL